ncbi:hypothetical protein [Kineosporia mesophila]|uniref:hypothetical protein n=1 Tax=Kineosporia mesophila TaxID=566012 RepID=UPI001E28A3B4|nr:hypothetical protein [Kineosporia mesophila]MCD5354247.1 hypothetical protein [Kineosporia mesophila]
MDSSVSIDGDGNQVHINVNVADRNSQEAPEPDRMEDEGKPYWPDFWEAVGWCASLFHWIDPRSASARHLAVLKTRWTASSAYLPRFLAVLRLVVSTLFLLLGLVLITVFSIVAVPWRIAYRRMTGGAVAGAVAITCIVAALGYSFMRDLPLVSATDAAAAPRNHVMTQDCQIRRLASGAGSQETLSVGPGSRGFDLQIITNRGTLTLRPAFGEMTCAAFTMKELVAIGFYDGRRCDRLSYGILECFGSEPLNKEIGFRISSTSQAINPVYDSREGNVSLLIDSDDRVTGLLSMSLSDEASVSSAGMNRYSYFGQIMEGLNVLSKISDAGTSREYFWSESYAKAPLKIKSVSVLEWPGALPPVASRSSLEDIG